MLVFGSHYKAENLKLLTRCFNIGVGVGFIWALNSCSRHKMINKKHLIKLGKYRCLTDFILLLHFKDTTSGKFFIKEK